MRSPARISFAVLALALLLAAPPARAVVTGTTTEATPTGNGSTKTFSFAFKATDKAWVQVLLGGAVQSAGYTVTLNSNQDSAPGGSVTFTTAPADGVAVKLRRVVPMTQPTVYRDYDPFPAKTHEAALDRAALIAQQLDRDRAELAAKHEADKAAQDSRIEAIALGIPGDPGALAVKATGATVPRRLADRFADSVNVLDYGAKCDGTTDDGAKINEAAAAAAVAAPGTPAKLVFPAGRCATSVPLAIAQRKGVIWEGQGKQATRIVPLAGLAGLSVVKWTNVRDSVIRDMGIEGNGSAPPGAGIEFRVDVIAPETSTSNTVENVWINASSTVNGMVDGIKTTAAGGQDHDNDGHVFRDNLIEKVSRAAYRFEHSNSLLHQIEGGRIYYPSIGVQALAGSFTIRGTYILANTREFEIGAGGAPLIYHPIHIIDVHSEVPSPGTSPNPVILYVDSATPWVEVYVTDYERQASSTGATLIDFRSAHGTLSIAQSRFNLGFLGNKLLMPASADSKLRIANTLAPFEVVTAEGTVSLANVDWGGATPVVTANKVYESGSTGTVEGVAGKVRAERVIATAGTATGWAEFAFSATVAINAATADTFKILCFDGRAFTVSNPTNGTAGQRITLLFQNNSGADLGAVTWGSAYRLAIGSAWVSPWTWHSAAISFFYDGTTWRETARVVNTPN